MVMTVKGGFFEVNGVTTYTFASGRNYVKKHVARLMASKQMQAIREKLRTDNGAAVGSTASKTYARVEANSELGGKRTIESLSLVNAATVTADVTESNLYLLENTTNTHVVSPVENKDKNPLGTR